MSDKHEPEIFATLPEPEATRSLDADRTLLPRVSLLVYHRDGAEMVPLDQGRGVIIGRDAQADLSLRDPSLSRQHARFELVGDQVWVEDLGSTNGTRVNDERIDRRDVGMSDEIALGAVTVSIHTFGPQEAHAYGLEGHDWFTELLEDEVDRARSFGRTLGLLLVREAASRGGHLNRWVPKVRSRLRRFDRMALYSTGAVEILSPESTLEHGLQLAGAILDAAEDTPLVCGVGSFPSSATSAEALMEAVVAAAQKANARNPVQLAASQASKSWKSEDPSLEEPIVRSEAMRAVYATTRRLSKSVIPVLLYGETGTGKELVARALHEAGPRRERPMRCVNCGAIPSNLIESTLFGHERGAFTGANERTDGVFLSGDGGTVFLDEVGELPPQAQAALLRVLETKRLSRVGSNKEVEVDVRIVAATHRDLEEMSAAGDFRWDLLYRLNAVTLKIPPLRERVEEIEPLVDRFVAQANRANETQVERVEPDALALLTRYRWPGNVRELRNAIERAAVIAQENVITVDDLPERVRGMASPPGPSSTSEESQGDDLKSRVQQYEAHVILDALIQAQWDRSEAARALGLPLRTLAHKMGVLGIKKPE